MKAKVLLVDVDNTLYPASLGVVDRIDERINAFLVERIGIDRSRADEIRRRWWTDHGSTLSGLVSHHDVDPGEYLDFVHDVPLADVLRPRAELVRGFRRVAGRRVLFTNASARHARNVIGHLGLDDVFEGISSIESRGLWAKPDVEAFTSALEWLGLDAGECVLLDDDPRNVETAVGLGMSARLVEDRVGSLESILREISEGPSP